MTPEKHFIAAIGGPTASGKSSLAMAMSSLIPVQIINFDSMQVYRGMDVGTAKATAEELGKVSHHLLDLCDPDEPFSVGRYIPLFREVVKEVAVKMNATTRSIFLIIFSDSTKIMHSLKT